MFILKLSSLFSLRVPPLQRRERSCRIVLSYRLGELAVSMGLAIFTVSRQNYIKSVPAVGVTQVLARAGCVSVQRGRSRCRLASRRPAGGSDIREVIPTHNLPHLSSPSSLPPTMSLSSKLSIKDVSLKGERVLIRVDFNVPMDKKTNEITNPAVSGPSLSRARSCSRWRL